MLAVAVGVAIPVAATISVAVAVPFPLPLPLPLPVEPLPLSLPLPLPPAGAVTTAVATPDTVVAPAPAAVLPLPLFELFWPNPPAPSPPFWFVLVSLQTVSPVGEFLAEEFRGPDRAAPWARPWVAFPTFSLTSPSAPEIRIAFRLVSALSAASPC